MSARERFSNEAVAIAAGAAMLSLVPVAAHQVGLVKHLPDPPGDVFASDEITESAMAHPLGVPDALAGLASYGVTLGLAVAARRSPAARRMLAGKLVADGCVAGVYAVRQVLRLGVICSWCMGTTLCTAAMVVAGRRVIGEEARRVLAGR